MCGLVLQGNSAMCAVGHLPVNCMHTVTVADRSYTNTYPPFNSGLYICLS